MTIANRVLSTNVRSSLFPQPLKPTLAFGAVALCATSSQAGIVSTNVDITTVPNSLISVNYSGGQFLISSTYSSDVFLFEAPLSTGKSGYFNEGSALVTTALLGPGTVIGPGSSWGGVNFLTTADADLSDQYIGLRLGSASDYMYGYVQFSTGANYTPPNTGGFDNVNGPEITMTQIALDTTQNEPITTPVVPEPSSLALLGLAGGVTALLRRRKTWTA